MRLKWKLRLYYGALLVVLLGLVGAATTGFVLHDFERQQAESEAEAARFAARVLDEGLAAIHTAVLDAAQDPELLELARRDAAGSRERTFAEWLPLATKLAQKYELSLFKILDSEGQV